VAEKEALRASAPVRDADNVREGEPRLRPTDGHRPPAPIGEMSGKVAMKTSDIHDGAFATDEP
jgi:hypothetical protein